MKRKGKCIHYNGTVNECCKAGVNYKELAGEPVQGFGLRLPCHGPDFRTSLSGGTLPRGPESEIKHCDKRVEPTAEEIADDEEAAKERFDLTMKARKAIVEHLGGPWKKGMPGSQGEIPCPCCGAKDAKLRFSRAGYNGHIHAACTEPDCVRWME